jgi:hypothetical protein
MIMNIKKPFVVLDKCKIYLNFYDLYDKILFKFFFFRTFRLEGYDYDRKFPLYGFGAKFNKELSHAYPLNNNKEDVRELKLFI